LSAGRHRFTDTAFECKIGHGLEHRVRVSQHVTHDVGRHGALNIHLAELSGQIVHLDIVLLAMPVKVCGDALAHPGVDHHQIRLRGEHKDNRVVEHVPFSGQERAVDRPTGPQRRFIRPQAGCQIVGEAKLQKVLGCGAVHQDRRHMAGIENAGMCQNGQVLVLGGPIPQGHVIAPEKGHAGPVLRMPGMQWRCQRCHDQ